MKEDKLPEERLFDIIQKEKNVSSDSNETSPKFSALKKNIDNIKSFLEQLKNKIHLPKNNVKTTALAFAANVRQMELKAINNVLIVVLAGFAILTLQQMLVNKPSVAKITDAISKIKVFPAKKRQVKGFETLDYYLECVKTRNIFEPYSEKTEEAESETDTMLELQQRSENLVLQGIAWSKEPQAMIKDKMEEKMYFVGQGKEIGATGVKVETILEDEVTISYGGSEMKLS